MVNETDRQKAELIGFGYHLAGLKQPMRDAEVKMRCSVWGRENSKQFVKWVPQLPPYGKMDTDL